MKGLFSSGFIGAAIAVLSLLAIPVCAQEEPLEQQLTEQEQQQEIAEQFLSLIRAEVARREKAEATIGQGVDIYDKSLDPPLIIERARVMQDQNIKNKFWIQIDFYVDLDHKRIQRMDIGGLTTNCFASWTSGGFARHAPRPRTRFVHRCGFTTYQKGAQYELETGIEVCRVIYTDGVIWLNRTATQRCHYDREVTKVFAGANTDDGPR